MLNTVEAYKELKAIPSKWPMWLLLGTQDIRLRYRRSILGPLWITISMAVTICTLGILYSVLFHVKLDTYFPFLASGIISWMFISTVLLDSNLAFIESETFIKNQSSYMSVFIMRILVRNTIIFAHNLLVFIPVFFFFHLSLGWNTLLIIPGLLIIALNAVFWGTVLAIVGTRYRDFSQIIASLMQIIFFITPVMWIPESLPDDMQWFVLYNPFYEFVRLLRGPMLNQGYGLGQLIVVTVVTAMGFVLYLNCMHKYKHRIVFWL